MDFRFTQPVDDGAVGIYIHIPFCVRRCNYCNFVTTAHDESLEAIYVRALMEEMKLWAEKREFCATGAGFSVDAMYFGGGTPSVLKPEWIGQIIETCKSLFHFGDDVEISLEVNPGTASPSRLKELRSAGVNRVSLGVQSLDPEELRRMGRIHSPAGALAALKDVRKANFENVSVDLIAAYPGQTPHSLRRSLNGVLEWNPEHLSVYLLEQKAGTKLERQISTGELAPVDKEEAFLFYQEVCALAAEAGYEHYEMSSFARNGMYCRHNLKYRQDTVFFGFGAGAHGMTGRWRYVNAGKLSRYWSEVTQGRLPFETCLELKPEARFKVALIMGSMLVKGVDLARLGKRYGVDAVSFVDQTIGDLADSGLFEISKDWIVMSHRARIVSNEIFARWA